jgi:hypothetical protein
VLITIAYANGSKPVSELYVESLMPEALLRRMRENPFAPRWRDVLDGTCDDLRESIATVSRLAAARVQDWAPSEGVPYEYRVVLVACYAAGE